MIYRIPLIGGVVAIIVIVVGVALPPHKLPWWAILGLAAGAGAILISRANIRRSRRRGGA